MFITFEGIDGSGKSTQVNKLARYCTSLGKQVVVTREPGGSEFAESLRNLIMKVKLASRVELLLFLAARYDHFQCVVLPALKMGKIVICDRFIDSTLAYQGYGMGLDIDLIKNLHSMILGEKFYPDVTFLLDVDISVALSRAKGKYEDFGKDFYVQVKYGYRKLAGQFPSRFKVINANDEVEAVYSSILRSMPASC